MPVLISIAALLAILVSTPELVWSDAAGQYQAEVDQCEGYDSAEATIQHPARQQAQTSRSISDTSSNTDSIASSGFPSGNAVRTMTGKQLQELLSSFSANGSSSNSSAVVLFYLETCPHSSAVRPVFECLAAFFPDSVVFASVSYSDMSLMLLMTHGLHALPVLQVNRQGRKYHYSGKHWLGPMLAFVAKAVGQEPLASLEVAQLCTQGKHQLPVHHQHAAMQLNATNPADIDPDARHSNTADGASAQMLQQAHWDCAAGCVMGNTPYACCMVAESGMLRPGTIHKLS